MERAWQALKVGEVLGPVTYQITDRVVDSFSQAIEETHPWFLKTSPFGGRIAQPDLPDTDYGHLMANQGTSLGYHARHHAEFLLPVKVGDTLNVTGRLKDKFKRRGFRYYTLDYQAVNQQGQVVYRQTITTTVGVLRNLVAGEEHRLAALPAQPMRPGEIVLMQRVMTQDKMNSFAVQSAVRLGREPTLHKGHHTDVGYARAVGLKTTIAQALHYVAWIGEAMTERLGQGWVSGGVLDMVFLNSVEPGDTVTIRGLPTKGQAGNGRPGFEITVLNQRNELVAVGETSGATAPQ
jgi:acyl dehydratase